jgi:hypothetical protein
LYFHIYSRKPSIFVQKVAIISFGTRFEKKMPMTNFSSNSKLPLRPSPFVIRVVIGYAAARQKVYSAMIGDFHLIMN